MRIKLAFILCLFFGFAAHADALNYDTFSQIPIQHEGRIKPLDTFARVHLQRFYGASHIGDMSAIQWLAQTMFDPAKAMEQPIFLVKDADAQAMLNLPSRSDNLYNFAETTSAIAANRTLMEPLLQMPASELSNGQRAVMELYENTGLFTQIMLSNTLFLSLSIHLPQDTDKHLSAFIDYYASMPELKKSLQAIVKNKGTNVEKYSLDEIQLAQAMRTLDTTAESTADNVLFRVIPPTWGGTDEWLSPWAIFHQGQGSPHTAEHMTLWRSLANAYQAQDADAWQKTSLALREKMLTVPGVRPDALSLEVLYYRWLPLAKSMALYVVGFVFTLLCLTGLPRVKTVRVVAFLATSAGATLHAASIAARVYILQRPPVGTLYESLLFVSLIAVLFGLFLESRFRNALGLLVATFAGSLLLFASQSFSGDDTMSMLIAVLNTNFWLATHVLCITTGYGFGLVAGIIAHVYLIMRCLKRPAENRRQVLRGGYGTALIALLFTSFGTILGGIWADQSWGRFWGWDPKENGALLICLWLIWLLHSRISGHFGERGFAVGLSLLNIVIALSWLGVNLLSTGLHSYGFTDKAAWALATFCGVECSFAAITYFILWRRERGEIY